MNDSLWVNAGGSANEPEYTARELRRAMAMLLTQAGTADRFGARAGVHPGGAPAVFLDGDTVVVQNSKAVAYPGLTTLSGPYIAQIQEAEHVLDAADGSNPRKDIVVLRQYDDDEDASTRRETVTEYIVGEPASSPSEPAVPQGAFRLATIDVPADGTGSPSLNYNAPLTVAHGGVIPVRDDSELPATDGGMYDGLARWNRSTNELQVHNGAAEWETVAGDSRPKGAVAGGSFYFTEHVGTTEATVVTNDTADPVALTFTADASRTYRATFVARVVDKDTGGDTSTQDAKGAAIMRLRHDSGSSITTGSPEAGEQQATVFDGNGDFASGATMVAYFEPSSGTTTVGLTLQSTVSDFEVRTFPSTMVVEDIGPALGL